MKTFLLISCFVQLAVGSFTLSNKGTSPQTEIVSTVNEERLTLRAPRKFKGADVEVIAANGYVVSSQKLVHRKHIIDFAKVVAGTYKVIVKKGNNQQEFTFTKK